MSRSVPFTSRDCQSIDDRCFPWDPETKTLTGPRSAAQSLVVRRLKALS